MDLSLQQIEEFLVKAKNIPNIETTESTIFSIGGKGYYENPTTDMLAFFCDDSGTHGLGALVLEALISCLSKKYQNIDCSLSSPVEREVTTESGKRIDLLLENQEWVMVLENKIFHQQNNPFKEYRYFIEKEDPERFANKQAIFVVLSPSGDAPTDWVGLSYPTLIEAVKSKLANYFISQPLNKWVIFLREFLLHLEGVMSKSSVPQESIDFVFKNLAEIREIKQLQDNAINAFHQELQQELQNILEKDIKIRLKSFWGFPALRFAYDEWETKSDVVLFLDKREGKQFCVRCYTTEISNDEQRQQSDAHFKEQDCKKPWSERSSTYRCYEAHFNDLSHDSIKEKLAHKLCLMDKFEKNIRPKF